MNHLPIFPSQVLPEVLSTWVEMESEATQTPCDLAGLLALAVCGSRIARKVSVSARDGWIEPTNIFAAILLEPGNRKSAVFADATKPLREIEVELIEDARPEVARLATRRRQSEARLKKLERKIAESSQDESEARYEADQLAEALEREPLPVLPRIISDDATDEKTAMMLAAQGGRLASMSAEGGVFDVMAGKYTSKGEAFNTHLKAHAGDDIVVDRIGRESVSVSRPALTCAYAIQPQVIQGLASNPAFRGRGLLGRFLYAAPVSKIGSRSIAPEPVPEFVHEHYAKLVRSLGTQQEHVIRLDDMAVKMFMDWEAEIEYMLGDGGEMMPIRDWGAKLAGATLRLAGIMHCCESQIGDLISLNTIRAAIWISKYLIPHAKYVLTEMTGGGAGENEQEKLVRWISSRNGQTSIRELSHSGPRQYRNRVVDAEFALNELRDAGFGDWEFIRPGSQGGRPTRMFRLGATPNAQLTIPPRENGGAGTETTEFQANAEVLVPSPVEPQTRNGAAP